MMADNTSALRDVALLVERLVQRLGGGVLSTQRLPTSPFFYDLPLLPVELHSAAPIGTNPLSAEPCPLQRVAWH